MKKKYATSQTDNTRKVNLGSMDFLDLNDYGPKKYWLYIEICTIGQLYKFWLDTFF